MGRKRGVQYRPGSFYRSDDRSGFTQRAENTRQEWTGDIVARNLWEPRQPQDFVKGIPDIQVVPNPRPTPPPLWDGPTFTTLSQNAAIGATFLFLASTAGFTAGNQVGVMLDSGTVFNTSVSGPPASNGITIAAALPGSAASGNQVTDYGAVGP